MEIFRLKRAVTWISVALAGAAVALYAGTRVYRASSTGGDVTCGVDGCYDTICLLFFLSTLVIAIIIYVVCNYYCGTDAVPFEQKTECRLGCAVLILTWTIIVIIAIEMLCRSTPPGIP